MYNGAELVTFDYDVIIDNKITPNGIVTLVLPKQNYWFMRQGANIRECLIYDCDDTALKVTVKTAVSQSASYDTIIPVSEFFYNFEEGGDTDHDQLQILLANEEDIEPGLSIKFQIYPCKNPPTLRALETFGGWTMDYDENKIEEWEGVSYQTTLANVFSDGSYVDILDTDPDWDDYMVSMTLRTYHFYIELGVNDIPLYTVIYVKWPDNWELNCDTDQYVPVCIQNCGEFALICNPTTNTLELYGGFQELYIQFATGFVEFNIEGIDNPPITEEKFLTVETWSKEGGDYIIDSQFSLFNLEFVTGLITVTEIYPSDPVIFSSNGTYTFTFNAQHTLLTTYELIITMPASLEVQQNSACTMYIVENPDYSCAADAAANQVTLRDFLLEEKEPLTSITISFDSIRNPIDYIQPGETIFKITDG